MKHKYKVKFICENGYEEVTESKDIDHFINKINRIFSKKPFKTMGYADIVSIECHRIEKE